MVKHFSESFCLIVTSDGRKGMGGREGIRPVKKTEWWSAGMVIWGEVQICICPS